VCVVSFSLHYDDTFNFRRYCNEWRKSGSKKGYRSDTFSAF
jgi:hypothetical protein